MLMTLVLMALQALEATQNIMVVQNLGVMFVIIVWKDICKKVSLYNAPRAPRRRATMLSV